LPITFVITVDDFGIKYVGHNHAEHLISTIKDLYQVTTYWEGTLYCGITLKWDYSTRTVDTSMPDYVAKVITKLCASPPQRPQHSPHSWRPPTYGTNVQYTAPNDTSALLSSEAITHLGILLYY
jgi:hypothetical protein